MLTTKMKPITVAIKAYYTWDEKYQCVADWNALCDVEQAQHILAHSTFYQEYCKSADAIQKDLETQAMVRSEQWQQQMKALLNHDGSIIRNHTRR